LQARVLYFCSTATNRYNLINSAIIEKLSDERLTHGAAGTCDKCIRGIV
jgi:hypothetical protein